MMIGLKLVQSLTNLMAHEEFRPISFHQSKYVKITTLAQHIHILFDINERWLNKKMRNRNSTGRISAESLSAI